MALVRITVPEDRVESFQARAEFCRVLTDPKRLAIVEALRDGERSVGDLADELSCSLPNVSQHLSTLRAAGLVARRRDGTTVYYRLAEPRILEACEIVAGIVERIGRSPTEESR